MNKMRMLIAVLLLAGLLLVPVTGAMAQLGNEGGSGGDPIPELPVGALSIMVAVGASVVFGSKLIKKKKKE